MSERAEHWDGVFSTRSPQEVSWFTEDHDTSLDHLAGHPGSVVDVGAGASTLVDALLASGRDDVTLLDVSAEALAVTRARLGHDPRVHEVVTDLLDWRPERHYDAWHDRAVLHFLTEPADQASYVALARSAVTPGGLLVLATFGPDGPTACSGLPAARHSAEDLERLFAPHFVLERASLHVHRTPSGSDQQFTWVALRHAPRTLET